MNRIPAFIILVVLLFTAGWEAASSAADFPAPGVAAPGSENQYAPAHGDMIVIGDIADAAVLLPILALDVPSTRITDLIYSGLLKYDKNIELVGDLAEKWEVSEDQLRIRFFLRKGVQWHDGSPFTSRDVLYTYKVHVDPKTPTPHGSRFMTIKELRVLDDHTVDVIYEKPFAPALDSWVLNKILPGHLLEGTDVTSSPLKRSPVGTGPYKFREWKTGERIVLNANPDYFNGAPYISRVIFRIVPDQATLFLQLKAGGIDAMTLTELQYTRQTDTQWFGENFKKYRYADFGHVYLGYNLDDWKFRDRKVRQALTVAIDREAIIKCALLGMSRVAHAPYKPDSYWHNPDVVKWPYDPEKAGRMLAEAGWKDTDGDGILDKDGKPFEFTIITNQGSEARKNAATIIQCNLKKVGIRVNIRVLEWAAFLKDFLQKRNFEAYLCGWISTVDPDEIDRWHSSKTGQNQFNHLGYRNPEADRLLEAGASTHDRKARKNCYDKFQEVLADDQPVTFLWVIERLRAVHSRFQGIDPGAVGLDYNFEQWYVPKHLQKYKIEP